MAPEIFKKQVYDGQVDVWALCVLLYKMLFGDFPFKSNADDMKVSTWSMRLCPNATRASTLRRWKSGTILISPKKTSRPWLNSLLAPLKLTQTSVSHFKICQNIGFFSRKNSILWPWRMPRHRVTQIKRPVFKRISFTSSKASWTRSKHWSF